MGFFIAFLGWIIKNNLLYFFVIIMKTLLIILLIISGIIFVWSVLLMSPKGGLGSAIRWLWGSEAYGSKKSMEGKLKKVAIVTSIIFVIISLALPYVN